MENLQQLLKKVKKIKKQDNEISKLKQENFNIFSILRKEWDEEHLHSTFLYALLDPNGTHEMGTIFLDLFVKRFCDNIHTTEKDIKVHKEKSIENGRVDIYIEYGNFLILIENKIWAGEKYKQIKRYHDHLKNKNGKLFYLTLDGREASENSADGLKADKDYFTISYNERILRWLNDCQKEAVENPTVRETIKQYSNLIKKLTGQLTNQIMGNKISEAIAENIEEARIIRDHFDNVKIEKVRELLGKVKEKLEQKYEQNIKVVIEENLSDKKWKGLYVEHTEFPFQFRIEGLPKIVFDGSNFGIRVNKPECDEKIIGVLQKDLSKDYPESKPSWYWPFYHNKYNFGNPYQEVRLFKETDEFADDIAEDFIKLIDTCLEHKEDLKDISIN